MRTSARPQRMPPKRQPTRPAPARTPRRAMPPRRKKASPLPPPGFWLLMGVIVVVAYYAWIYPRRYPLPPPAIEIQTPNTPK